MTIEERIADVEAAVKEGPWWEVPDSVSLVANHIGPIIEAYRIQTERVEKLLSSIDQTLKSKLRLYLDSALAADALLKQQLEALK